MSKVVVFGHKNPDTDSICSSIVMANLQTKIRGEEVVPCRLGEINEETKYALDYFKAETPKLIEKYTDTKILGVMPHIENLKKINPNDLISNVLTGIDIESVFDVKIAKLEL